ncbi:hypothetical protein FQN57_004415 [Myotisia sp. PD_48]|nr:hypothetical protein FQN57_004415 [Myotisia sp. PD_48]
MPPSVLSKQRKHPRSEHQPPSPPPKKQKPSPSNSWDSLFQLWLTKNALAELDRRNARRECYPYLPYIPQRRPLTRALHAKLKQHKHDTPRDPLLGLATEDIQSIRQFARRGGPDPDLTDLRYHPEPVLSEMAPFLSTTSPSRETRGRKRSARSPPGYHIPRKPNTKTTATTTADKNFEQMLVDHGYYPTRYRHPDGCKLPLPNNWAELQSRIPRRRASLSPSRFSGDDFERFQDTDWEAIKKFQALAKVIPTIEGGKYNNKTKGEGKVFGNLDPLVVFNSKDQPSDEDESDDDATPMLAPARPDLFYGARAEQLDHPIRKALCHQIIPSKDFEHVLPNFFLEVGPQDGSFFTVPRKALYHGALGTRAMHALQSYKQEAVTYDCNAHTISAIYRGGQLAFYAHHIIPSTKPSRKTETIVTQLKMMSITSDAETFRQGAIAYRNLRDWAADQAAEHIAQLNGQVSEPMAQQNGQVSGLTPWSGWLTSPMPQHDGVSHPGAPLEPLCISDEDFTQILQDIDALKGGAQVE